VAGPKYDRRNRANDLNQGAGWVPEGVITEGAFEAQGTATSPETGAMALLGTGLLGLGIGRHLKRKAS
jgi:hypothetical protein